MEEAEARQFHSDYLSEKLSADSGFRGLMQRQILGGSRAQRNFSSRTYNTWAERSDPKGEPDLPFARMQDYEADEEGWRPTEFVSADPRDLYYYVEDLKKVTGAAARETRQAIGNEARVVAETVQAGRKRLAGWVLEEPEPKRPAPESGFEAAFALGNLRGRIQELIGTRGVHRELTWADVAGELIYPQFSHRYTRRRQMGLGEDYWDLRRDEALRQSWFAADPGYPDPRQ